MSRDSQRPAQAVGFIAAQHADRLVVMQRRIDDKQRADGGEPKGERRDEHDVEGRADRAPAAAASKANMMAASATHHADSGDTVYSAPATIPRRTDSGQPHGLSVCHYNRG